MFFILFVQHWSTAVVFISLCCIDQPARAVSISVWYLLDNFHIENKNAHMFEVQVKGGSLMKKNITVHLKYD